MKKRFEVIILTVWLLMGCSPVPISSPTAVSVASPAVTTTTPPTSPTPTPTSTLQNTRTPNPTYTATVTPTPPPKPASTFDPNNIIRPTLAPPAECPPKDLSFQLPDPIEFNNRGEESFTEGTNELFEANVLELLNQVGADAFYKFYLRPDKWEEHYFSSHIMALADLTHDGVNEIVIASNGFPWNIYVFGCVNSEYKTLLVEKAVYETGPNISFIGDTNLNGVADIVMAHATCHYCTGVRVYEWDGQQFQSLARQWMFDGIQNQWFGYDMVELEGLTQVEIQDTDSNGTLEIILDGGRPSWMAAIDGSEGPFREQTIVHMWNGKYYEFYSQEYRPPVFRFEAIQDADMASRRGKYEEALGLYQAVIFSDTLMSWTRTAWFELISANPANDYPDASLMPFNQTEYDQLSAYARYRIMLLHVVRGWESDALTVLETLRQKYPFRNAGHPYVEMAEIFWKSYETSGNLATACSETVIYAEQHEELLEPLGNGDQGLFSSYSAQEVCPFDE